MSTADSNALDSGQYTHDAIRKYEAAYGYGFISPGGRATTQAILSLVDIPPGAHVLDVGCGLGGAALLIAQTLGARVHGVDLSRNMLEIAHARAQEAQLAHAVTFEHADIVRYEPTAAFDLVHSRDAFLHIHEKKRLFAVLIRCLRPGGRLIFTDYLCGTAELSDEFTAYIRERKYDLRTLDAYRDLLARAGFQVLLAEDRTADFIAILEQERDRLRASDLGAQELIQSWQAKIRRAQAGEQRWGVLIGQKPD
jgi:phosphoethanolamine N-methyltransferase